MAEASDSLGALAAMPTELVQDILSHLDASSLARLEAVSTAFRGRELSTERAAEEAVLRLCGEPLRAARWR